MPPKLKLYYFRLESPASGLHVKPMECFNSVPA